jgi:hypothetical protein
MEEVRQQAFDRCVDLAKELIESMLGPDGETVGDRPLDRGNRIARVKDMSSRGVMDVLEIISPTVYSQIVKQYTKDVDEYFSEERNK